MPFAIGQNATISCVTDIPANDIVWKQGNGVVTDQQFQAMISHLNLTFSPVNDSIHETTYTCEANLTGSGDQPPATANVTVTVEGIKMC